MSNMFRQSHNSLPSNSSQWNLDLGRQAAEELGELEALARDGSQTPIALSPMAKIIDIGQKTPRHLNHQDNTFSFARQTSHDGGDEQSQQQDVLQQHWNAPSRTSGHHHQQANSSSQQQVNELGDSSGLSAHKQQSGETLSSFESDYDLLVYLGETETEDIVDTERSLDYQDHTWRQSICGASLAPTIDESLSELTGHHSLIIGGGTLERQPASTSNQQHLLDPSSTPTLLSANHSPFATPSPSRSPLPLKARSYQQLDSDECDNEVSFVMQSEGNRYGAPTTSKASSLNNKFEHPHNPQASPKKPARTWKQNTNQLAMEPPSARSATIGRERAQPSSAAFEAPGDELDKLLAEMSQSLDLDSLARFDPQPQLQRQFVAGRDQLPRQTNKSKTLQRSDNSRVNRPAPAADQWPRRLEKKPVAGQMPAASSESILDEFDGASRMLEQMISDQLKESVANRQRRQRGDSQSINSVNSRDSPRSIIMANPAGQVPAKLQPQPRPAPYNQRPQRVNELARGESQSDSQTTPQVGSRKVSSCSSSVASTVLLPGNRHEQSASPTSRRLRGSSGSSNTVKSIPPPPPKVDYAEEAPEARVLQLEPEEMPAPPSSDDEELKQHNTLVAVPSQPPPPSPESGQPIMDRMKRRTLSSMRSMRNKISDLMPGQHHQRSQPSLPPPPQRPPRPPKRSSSIGSRTSAAPQNRVNLVEPKTPREEPVKPEGQVRESRSKARRGRNEAGGEKQSFGQQLRERLSRSKSRFSRFLLGHKRSKSQPSKSTFSEPSASAENDRALIGPGDIARNSGSNLRAPEATGSSASTPSSFNRSLDRHLAADMARRRESSGSSSSSLSGLAETSPGDRSRQRRRKATSPRDQAPRPLSVVSLAARAKRQQSEPEQGKKAFNGSASAGASPAPCRRPTTTQRIPAYFGPASSLADAAGGRRSSSQDELANANIWQPRSASQKKRSQSMKSVRLSTPAAEQPDADTKSCKTESQLQLTNGAASRRLPLASNTFRPASALAQAPIEASKGQQPQNKVMDVRSLAATPIGLNGAPLDGERQLSLEPAPASETKDEQSLLSPGESARLSQRARSATALFGDIKQKCSGLFGTPAPAPAPAPRVPVAPPRRHRRSKSLVAQPPVLQPKPAPSPQPAQAGSSSAGKRLTLLAQQLKHTAADFFHQPSNQAKKKAARQPEDKLCEWKPVIGGGSSALPDATAKGQWVIAKGGTIRAPALKETHRMQSTFDTNDSTWESASNATTDADLDNCGSYSAKADSSDPSGQTSSGKQAGRGSVRERAGSGAAAAVEQQVGVVRAKQVDPNNNNNNNSRRTDDGDKCNHKAPVGWRIDADESRRQQVALESMASEHHSTKPTTTTTRAKQTFGADVERLNLGTGEAAAQHKQQPESGNRSVENQQQRDADQELRICETSFKFNADLPKPSEIFATKASRERDSSAFPESRSADAGSQELLEPKTNANKRQEPPASDVAQQEERREAPVSSEKEEAQMAGVAAATRGQQVRPRGDFGEADARFLKAISERRPVAVIPQRQEDEAGKRLSVYENEPMSQRPQLPPLPPAKPARPSMSSEQRAKVPDSPVSESWAVGEVDTWSRKKAQNKQVKEAKPQEVKEEPKPPVGAKPQLKRLTTMTSIIQDPMDELMNAPSCDATMQARERPVAAAASYDDLLSGSNNAINKQCNSDSDSSMAAPVISANRRRILQEKIAPPAPGPSSKPPITIQARPKHPAFNEGGRASGGSLVKRLAKNFDQAAAASSDPARGGKSSSLRSPLVCDEEKSEASQWFDAASGTLDDDEQQLDEAELAELLAEFEANESGNQQKQAGDKRMSMSISEDVSTGADQFVTVADSTLELAAATDSGGGADDTLNDGDDDDEDGQGRSPSPLADEVAPTEAQSQEQTGEQNERETSQNECRDSSPLNPPANASSPACDLLKPARVNDDSSSTDLARDNLSNNESLAEKSCFKQTKQQQQQQLSVTNQTNKQNNLQNDTNLQQQQQRPLSHSPESPTNLSTNNHLKLNEPTSNTTSDFDRNQDLLKPIDDSLFKNSLNNIIARRSSSTTTATAPESKQPLVASASDTSSSGRSSSSPTAAQQTGVTSQEARKHQGLARYYRALLGKRRSKSQKNKVQIDNYIHSSSGSSASSSSSSAASSRSNSPTRGEGETGRKGKVSRRSSTGNANSSAELLYEELERMLARRLSTGETSTQLTEQEDRNSGKQDLARRPLSEDQESLSSSNGTVSAETIPELRQRQNLQKLYHIVNEIYSSEAKFVETLKLLNIEFRRHMERWIQNPHNSTLPGHARATECIHQLLKHLPQLQALNESLLDELGLARDQWPRTKKIAHVLVKIGPFLKHYSTYIREFDSVQQQLSECQRKIPHFNESIKEFEASDKCQKLTLQHHLLRPIQRIPQYRLLLQQYLHHLKPDEADYEDTVEALEVVSRVAEHANQSMNEGVNFAKLLALQAKIVGKQRDIVQPGRMFVKEGELMKVCRKQVQPRWFVLLNDALLYLTQIQSSDILFLNNELPLDDCLVDTPNANELVGEQFETEFSVRTRTRSFALIAKSRQERDDWVQVLRQTIEQHLERRRSFQQQQQQHFLLHRSPSSGSLPANGIHSSTDTNNSSLSINGSIARPSSAYYLPPNERANNTCDAPLGHKAPLWTPDSRVTMCQLCTSSFSALFRRHHCRACGRVVCSACSANKAPLVYLKCRAARVCDQCFEQLKANLHLYYQLAGADSGNASSAELRRLDDHFRALIKGQFQRHGLGRRLSNASASNKQNVISSRNDSGILREISANDSGSLISGYLHRRHTTKPKWKRQWFVIRERVLYAYRAIDDVAAASTLPLIGYQVDQPTSQVDGLEAGSLIRLTHRQQHQAAASGKHNAGPIQHLFKAESIGAAERWLEAFKKSVVFEESS